MDVDGRCWAMQRLGTNEDGGKVICEDELPSHKLRVVSVGIGGERSFEKALNARYPNSAIYAYDGTISTPTDLRFASFYRQNLDRNTRFQVDHAHIFKVDCEGCEYSELLPVMENLCADQLLIEIHGRKKRGLGQTAFSTPSIPEIHTFMSKLNETYSVFYVEPNIQYSDGTCIEYAMKRRAPCSNSF